MNIVLTWLSLLYVNFSQLILVFIISKDIMMSSNNSQKLLNFVTENRLAMSPSRQNMTIFFSRSFWWPDQKSLHLVHEKPPSKLLSHWRPQSHWRICLKTLTCLARTDKKPPKKPSVPKERRKWETSLFNFFPRLFLAHLPTSMLLDAHWSFNHSLPRPKRIN